MLSAAFHEKRTGMTEKTTTEKAVASEDYISLTGVKQFLVRVLRWFFRSLGIAVGALRRRYYLLIAGILCGGLLGWLYPRIKGPYYQVSMIVEYRALDKSVYMNIVDELNAMIRSGSSRQLAARLGISPYLAKKVISLQTGNLQGNPLMQDAIAGNNMFRIIARLSASSGADTLGQGLMAYINGLPYVRAEMGEQFRIRQDQLVFIRREMDKLDSLKSEYAHSLSAGRPGGLYYNNAFDPVSIYKQSYSLDSLQAGIRQHVVQGDKALVEITVFRAADNPQSAPLWFYAIVLTALGFFAAWGLAIILEIKKKIDVDQPTAGR
jgi:hypothetical protein